MPNQVRTLIGIWNQNHLILPTGYNLKLYPWKYLKMDDYNLKPVAVAIVKDYIEEVVEIPIEILRHESRRLQEE